MRSSVLFIASLLFFLNSFAQQPSATELMEKAKTEAQASGKKIFVIFHASWCIWCKKMEASIADDAVKDYFAKNFVFVPMTVLESNDKKELETAGGADFMIANHGKGMGIPYWLIFDENGQLLFDSQIRKPGQPLTEKGQNIGCPASKDEVNAFISILQKTTDLSTDQEDAIRKRFRKNED